MSGELRLEELPDGGYRFTAPLMDDITRKVLRDLAAQKDAAVKRALNVMGWIAPEDVATHDAAIRAEVRAEVAREIDVQCDTTIAEGQTWDPYWEGYTDGLDRAARIAEGRA